MERLKLGHLFTHFAEAKSGVVYQNEEGCWVTDLAYYYSLDQEQDQFHLPTDLSHSIQEEDFISGGTILSIVKYFSRNFQMIVLILFWCYLQTKLLH